MDGCKDINKTGPECKDRINLIQGGGKEIRVRRGNQGKAVSGSDSNGSSVGDRSALRTDRAPARWRACRGKHF